MPWKKKMIDLALAVALIYVCVVGFLYVIQRNMLYFPSPEKPSLGSYAAKGVVEIDTQTDDGLKLAGWLKEPREGKEIILFFHGNASNISLSAYKSGFYAAHGYGFLAAGYRGYSGNPGKPTEQGLYKDARAWVKKLGEMGYPPEKIILYGESLGTGVAVQMGTEYREFKAIILESPYTSIPDLVRKRYFFIPLNTLIKDQYRSRDKLQDVRSPIVVIHGDQDTIIPVRHGENMYAAASEPKKFVVVPGFGHNNMPEDVKATGVLTFLAQH